jgi:hypothetical protein
MRDQRRFERDDGVARIECGADGGGEVKFHGELLYLCTELTCSSG